MPSTNTLFSRRLLTEAHNAVHAHFPRVHLIKDAWTYNLGRDQWEFHGPDKFYWHGSAGNGYEARYKGWMAWLESKGIGGDDD